MDNSPVGNSESGHLDEFWMSVRPEGSTTERPEAWAFGATPDVADELLELVLKGTKRATAGALWDYEVEEEPLPVVGLLNIILDGSGAPRALIRITDVAVVPFDEVDAEHARLEGEGDLSLEYWRVVHQRFFTDHACHNRGFVPDMPVVLERFDVLHPAPARDRSVVEP